MTLRVIALTAGSQTSAVGHVIDPTLKHPPPLSYQF
jgi:hypothetical protein